ncbi:hypothetical protein F5Y06DRAFT_290337 [Hypoxylon sp. FL0890]|nr:hypothetical protein F5Y06DRAFT_290337 [Hypoxylon sp. FL0890]
MSTSTSAMAEGPRPPRYPTEKMTLERTPEKDGEAIKVVKAVYEVFMKDRRRRRSKWAARQSINANDNVDNPSKPAVQESIQDVLDQHERLETTNALSESGIALKSMYEGTGSWPKNWPKKSKVAQRKKVDPMSGATQYSYTNIGFPKDKSLTLEDFEDETHIDKKVPSIIQLQEDIVNIKTKLANEIADDGKVVTSSKLGRTIETFRVHGRTVTKAVFKDADVYGKKMKAYSDLRISKEFEKEVNNKMGIKPPLEVEQWVATHVLLSVGGQIGGATGDYWRKTRDLAQQHLFLDESLEARTREEIKSGSLVANDPSFAAVLDIVKKCISRAGFNPYHQAQRDDFAISQDMFYRVQSDIFMALDGAGVVIAFVFSDSFRTLLTKSIEKKVAQSLDTYSTLQPVPLPDMTRHGLHWVDWLVRRPDLDFRNPENDPRKAKSGVYHIGGRCATGDPQGSRKPVSSKDLVARVEDGFGHVSEQMANLQFSAFGACTEVVRFFFELIDPKLLDEYVKVANEVSRQRCAFFETRRKDDPFVMRAALVNLMTNEHEDQGDWHYGFAGLVSVGEFQGGDLLLRELGLRVESPPGCVQLIRGRELRHSITRWTGRRFVVVNVTHEPVRRYALRKLGESIPSSTATTQSCLDVNLEDELPEPDESDDERHRIPERHIEDSESPWSGSSSSRSAGVGQSLKRERGKKVPKHRNSSTSDADTEGSGEENMPCQVAYRFDLGYSIELFIVQLV